MPLDTQKTENGEDQESRINKGVELMLQYRRNQTPEKFDKTESMKGEKMLSLTLTFSALISVLFLCVGGIIGWLYQQHVQTTTIPLLHPEMFDENGNVVPDEIISFRFEGVENLISDEGEFEED